MKRANRGDVGGDKQVGYLGLAKEENPLLGYRALRICLKEPEDIANTIAFLCSEKAEYVTGAVIHVTGGLQLLKTS